MAYDLISRFAQQLIEETQKVPLPADYLEDYQARLEDQIVERLGLIALENMDEEGLKQYEAIIKETGGDLEKMNYEQVEKLWKKHIKNFEEVMAKGLAEFAKEYQKNISKDLKV